MLDQSSTYQQDDADDAAHPALQQVSLCHVQGTFMVAVAVERTHWFDVYSYMEAQSAQAWGCLLACDVPVTTRDTERTF